MATIRPDELPAAASVVPGAAIIVDNGATVEKATPIQVVDAAIPLASQAEAEAGADNAKRVTPLRVAQAIDALGVSAERLASGDSNEGAALMSDLRHSAAIVRSQQSINHEGLSVFDFMSAADQGYVTDADGAHAVGSGVQDAVDAYFGETYCRVLKVPAGVYLIDAPILHEFQAANSQAAKKITGYGAEIRPNFNDPTSFALELKIDNSAMPDNVGVRKLVLEGLQFRGLATLDQTGGMLKLNGGNEGDEFMYHTVTRDLFFDEFMGDGFVMSGNAFESQHYSMTSTADATNTTGYCVLLENDGSGIVSSVDFYGLTTRRGKHGLYVPTSAIGAKLHGGSIFSAAEHGANFGNAREVVVSGTHFEDNWRGGPGTADNPGVRSIDQAQLKIAGTGVVSGIYAADRYGGARYAVRIFSTETATITGGLMDVSLDGDMEYFAYVGGNAGAKVTVNGAPKGSVGRIHSGMTGTTNNYMEAGGQDGSLSPAAPVVGLTYGVNVATDASLGNRFTVTVTDNVNFTFDIPTNPTEGQTITYSVFNNSGGAMGTVSFGADFKTAGAFTSPANGNRRNITFTYQSAKWREDTRSAADQAN